MKCEMTKPVNFNKDEDDNETGISFSQTSRINSSMKAPPTYISLSSNMASYLFLVPFKFLWNSRERRYNMTSAAFRKVTCGLVYLVRILLHLNTLWIEVNQVTSSKRNLTSMFETVGVAALILFTGNMGWVLFTKGEAIQKLVNDAVAEYNSSWVKCQVLILFLNVFGLDPIQLAWNFQESFLHPGESFAIHFSSILGGVTNHNPILTSVKYTVSIYYYLAGHVNRFFMMFLMAVIWSLQGHGRRLSKELDNIRIRNRTNNGPPPFQLERGINQGLALVGMTKELIDQVLELISPCTVICLHVTSLSFFGQLPYYLKRESSGGLVRMFTLIFLNGLFWMGACDFHEKVTSSIKKWVYSYQKEGWLAPTDRLRLLTVISEIETMPMGLACPFFTVTYGFIGSMIGALVTYGIIVFQL